MSGKLVAGGYDPLLLPLRHVHREELALDRFMCGLPARPSPIFSRYWLDLVLSPDGTAPSAGLVEPWPFTTSVAGGTELTPWETLRFARGGASVSIDTERGSAVVLGVEVGPDGTMLDVCSEHKLAGRVELPPAAPHTVYVEVPLDHPTASVTMRAQRPVDISFAGVRRVTAR